MDRRHLLALQAETLVAGWLAASGGLILARRWRCRGGEIDLVARSGALLLFVEVKARSQGSWDSAGLEAVGATKRRRISRAAELYLIAHPDQARLACRFDVALVAIAPGGHLQITSYIEAAFELC
ncbi:YraN family protein [Gloeobacter kilaueensis]|uniref:UPF0102 protein GKIL_1379 n=1 Tax=Gloeobacter kilaueensis (strain ATCC BAA-2537 / CCAP 1431/1 / ULC 316 / JS1) TaxID=1183438 RepID=U5QIV8_GLOK1|nr:YraN family protein [Gloeobacter kilaueensis]AGY57625.1 putative endonuclease [Gloeobacter kilaueensis JS1]